jgi:hypothetical protein
MTACGEIAFQSGAGPDQLSRDRLACRAAENTNQCLREKGWTLVNVTEDERPKSQTPAAVLAAGPVTGTASASAMSALVPLEPRADPMRMVPISGWAHFGGGSPDQSISDCVAELGPAHRPDPVTKKITQALLACMQGKSWRAF